MKQQIKKIVENQKINKVYKIIIFPIEIIISFILSYGILNFIYKTKYSFQSVILRKILIIMSIILLFSIVIINCIKYRKKAENLFLTFVIPIGIMFLTFLMPLYAPDELAHIVKAYDVSQGNLVANNEIEDGKYRVKIPKALVEYNFNNFKDYEDLVKALEDKTDYSENVDMYTEAQSNCGIIYLSSAIGFLVARILDLNIMIGIYLARLCNFIFFIILGYFSIKIIPFGKIALYIYMFTPMFLQQATSLSPDCMINAVILFFISYILYLAFSCKDIRKRDISTIIITSMFIAVAKVVYIPILGILLILFRNKNIDKKKLIPLIISCYLLVIILGMTWLGFSSKYIDEREYIANNNVNSSEQIALVLENPRGFITLFKDTLKKDGIDWLFDFCGWRLGWQSIELHQICPILVLFILFTAPFIEYNEKSLNKKERVLMSLIVLGIFLIIVVGFYITWTIVGAGYITGVQGRYFLPIGIMILLSLSLKDNYVKGAARFYYLALVPINIIAILNIIQYFIK